MLKSLFTRAPEWQHADPDVRLRALGALPQGDPAIDHLARADADARVRIAAVDRSEDAGAIGALVAAEHDAAVREAMERRLVTLLGADDGAAWPDGWSPSMLAAAARGAPAAGARAAALARILDQGQLAALALDAPHDIRLAAAGRLVDEGELQRVAGEARNRDKGVFRIVNTALEQIVERRRQAVDAEQACCDAELLAGQPRIELSRVVELDRRWSALEHTAAWRDRFERAREAVARRLAEHAARQVDATRLAAGIGALRDAMVDGTADVDEAAHRLAALDRNWDAVAACAAAGATATWVAARADVGTRLASLQRAAMLRARRAALLAHIESAPAPLSPDELDAWQREWNEAAPADVSLAADEYTRYAGGLARHQVAVAVPEVAPPAVDRARWEAEIGAIEAMLQAGDVHQAQARCEAAAAAPVLPPKLAARLRRAAAEVKRLLDWERFAGRDVRERMCTDAEALAARELDPAVRARAVRELRQRWQALDEGSPKVPAGLRHRFDGACERAYAPAREWFRQHAALRSERDGLRVKLVEELEAAAAALGDGANPAQLKELDERLRTAPGRWRGWNAGGRAPARLQQRFDAAIQALTDRRAQVWAGELADRERLIEAMLALQAVATQPGTVAQVKTLQGEWQQASRAGTLPRSQERATWERFRAACDLVFAQRTARVREQDERRAAQVAQRADVCATLERLAVEGDMAAIRRAQRDAEAAWRGFTPAPSRALEDRFAAAMRALRERTRQLELTARAAGLAALQTAMRQCERLEESGTGSADEGWPQLDGNPPAWCAALDQRRNRALAPAGAAPAPAGDVGGRAQDLLLQLEATLGLDSPAHLQERRLALRVRALAEAMGGRHGAVAATPESLVVELLGLPAPLGEDHARLTRILERLAHAA